MKKFGLFLGGVLTGVVLTLLVLIVIAASNKTLDGVTNFEQVGDVVNETSVKVFQVIDDNVALVYGQDKNDRNYDYDRYYGAVYLLRNDNGDYYYDDEIVECPSGKQFRQTGIYQYNTKIGYKTVPIIELK